ncbi:TetR/AcrR family transcriptional regulator [Phenylobacterium deserti]|uniref:HTH tetR-type domain-containing protein n=1 Tax=Phenylobacterium deserti TaxID=1914756 RepID=A0A328AF36_9CAUL|nr:TetR/AcrR family transcriptional regulator [Phenylobacterium deserti]RAK52746.1 hypothetical protein DJ018_11195 [Phenylobacterium deserti]
MSGIHRGRIRTIEAVLDAAKALFEERPYELIAMEEIAARAGVARATLYYNFSSKQEIAVAVSERERRRALEGLRQLIDAEPPAEDVLQAVFWRAGQANTAMSEVSRIATLAALSSGAGRRPSPDDPWSTLRALEDLVRLGQRQEVFRSDLPAERLALMIAGLLLQVSLAATPTDVSTPAWAEELAGLALDALKARSA